ncbi:MAG: NINE protein [Bacilli bacterium]
MPNCKNCGARITKFDSDICPVCGYKHPIDRNGEETSDITSSFNLPENSSIKVKQKKRIVTFLLSALLGFTGLPFFYLGYKKQGIISLICNVLYIAVVGIILTFVANFDPLVAFLLIALLSNYIINIIIGFIFLFKHNLKDKSGLFLS